jgi:hypothetical protein
MEEYTEKAKDMRTYNVRCKRTEVVTYSIYADSLQSAVEKFAEGDYSEKETEYEGDGDMISEAYDSDGNDVTEQWNELS